MAQKIQTIKIGNKEFKYNLPSNSDIKKYIIEAYNETSNQLSYYSVTTEMAEWVLVADGDDDDDDDNEDEAIAVDDDNEDEAIAVDDDDVDDDDDDDDNEDEAIAVDDEDCVVITIYGTTDNGKVLNENYYKKKTSGEIEKLKRKRNLGKIESCLDSRLDTFQCEVEESVPSPNVSHPKFMLDAEQESNTRSNYYVQILEDKDRNTKFIKLSKSKNNKIKDSTIKLKSRRDYECKLYKVKKTGQQFVVTGVTEPITLTTRNNQKDVNKLMEKALSYINQKELKEYKVKYLYRNKPNDHETIIGIMKKYLKDNNGDPYSSIIKNIHGLHFSATPDNSFGGLPRGSHFGNYRIMIFPEYLVEGCNLYFADFYCMFTERHWVTLVLTKPGSDEDKFCQNRLVKLDIRNNPFFYKHWNEYRVTSWNWDISINQNRYQHTHLFCEILYTEDVNLTEMRLKKGFKEEYNIPPLGKGKSTPGGIRKKPWCLTCNLLPNY